MPFVTTSDGVRLHYEEHAGSPDGGSAGDGSAASGAARPLVLLHGWSFSGRFFDRNVTALARHARVVTVDLRGHGDSGRPGHGYRVARLAKDLSDLMAALDLRDVTVAGWSLGSAVIWSYLELFGTERLAQAVLIQQTPRQYYGLDWKLAHSTCYDDAALATLQAHVSDDPAGQDRMQLDLIMASEPTDDERRLFLAEMAKCPPDVRNAVMADHTRADWRDLLPTIALPTLVLAARKDPNFDAAALAYVAQAIPDARLEYFDDSSHALFLDEPDHFNRVVADFVSEVGGPRR